MPDALTPLLIAKANVQLAIVMLDTNTDKKKDKKKK